MKINPELTLREMAGEYIIVNPFSDTVDMTQIYTMNETAAWLWQQMEGKEFTAEDIAEALCEEYEVDKETALFDANELCTEWRKAGFLIE
ncbi:MAG: PqqD family protein [Bacteroidaceae bacterium]|nr:PqqD family protein [Bacteroidaceae bacterium]